MKKTKVSLPVKAIVAGLAILLVLAFVAGYALNFVRTSPYFKIKEIVSREGQAAVALAYLKGKNIFSVELSRESAYISQFFPEYRSVRLFRLLPNRLFVDFVKRTPVAVVKLYKYFDLDEEGVFFTPPPQPDASLPLITGLETKIFGPKSGKKYNVKELALALNILKEVNKNRVFKHYPVVRIDVANASGALVFIPISGASDSLEIRLNADNLKDKITVLSGIILAAKKELTNFKYVDLRFKDPVIKMRDAK